MRQPKRPKPMPSRRTAAQLKKQRPSPAKPRPKKQPTKRPTAEPAAALAPLPDAAPIQVTSALLDTAVAEAGPLDAKFAAVWRIGLQTCLRADERPDAVRSLVERGIEGGAWRHFRDAEDHPFDSFKAFCETIQPFGLGRPVDEVMAALERVLGKKGAQLATVPVARQGRRADLTSGHGGPKSSTRNDKRLRAIDNGPPVMRDLFHRDLIGVAEAAKVAAKVGDPATAVLVEQVEAVAAEPNLDPKAARQRINRLVSEALDPDKPLRAAVAAYRKLSPEHQVRFRAEIAKAQEEGAK